MKTFHTRPVLALCLAVRQGMSCEQACRMAGVKSPYQTQSTTGPVPRAQRLKLKS